MTSKPPKLYLPQIRCMLNKHDECMDHGHSEWMMTCSVPLDKLKDAKRSLKNRMHDSHLEGRILVYWLVEVK